MTTFNLIVKNIMKLDEENNLFLVNNINQTNYNQIDFIYKFFFNMLIDKKLPFIYKNKFNFIGEVIKNPLLKNKQTKFYEYFYLIQKTYHTLNRFVYKYKYRKSKIVVNTDLCLNELKICDKNVICIFHNNSKYLFNINELINIIDTSLTNSHMFFAEPLSIKNPYDNLPFSKSTLYNIYFYIKYNTYYRAELFVKFFYCDFNLTYFIKNNEYLLREYSIKNFVYKSPSNILIKEIKNMIESFNLYCKEHRFKNKIDISVEFPKDRLIKIMQPYLLLYCKSLYSYISFKKKEAEILLYRLLRKFNNYNPRFGRKRYKFVFKNIVNSFEKTVSKVVDFDDNYISLKTLNKLNIREEFLKDHLVYDEFPDVNNNYMVFENRNSLFYLNFDYTEDLRIFIQSNNNRYVYGEESNSEEEQEQNNNNDEETEGSNSEEEQEQNNNDEETQHSETETETETDSIS